LQSPCSHLPRRADEGHDINISFEQAVDLIGRDLAERSREVALECYLRGARWAAERGIIIADTKFEMGLIDGELVLADEVLTPDSSRFWPADTWAPGATRLRSTNNRSATTSTALTGASDRHLLHFPDDVVTATSSRYVRPTNASPVCPLAPGPE
jgi:phosphoribosylaminoimidazole-succinocarboxamide synthase